MADNVEVLDSFVGKVDKNGEDRVFRAGDIVRSNDPAVKKWPQLFGPVQIAGEPRIERATAAPGERRA